MKKIHYISLFMSLVMAFSFFMTAFVGCTVKENSPKKQLVHCDLIEPTCTENGRKEVWYEAYTNTYFLDSEGKEIIAAEDIIIPAEGHDMSFHPSKNASCTENGNVEYWSCSKCGHTYSDKYGNKILPNFIINSTGHKLAYNSKKEATCTTTGLEEHYECLNCNKVYLDQQCQKSIDPSELIIPAKGHSPIKQENVISVCVQDSQNIELLYVCSDCGKTFADKGCLHELETSVHDVSLVNEIAPKCTTEGIKEHYNCNVCGKNFLDKACTQLIEDVSLAPKGHSLTYYEKVTETSVKDGIKEHYFCSNCQRNYLDYDCTNECTENDLLLPATIGAEIVSYTFASVAFELLSYGYEVFNAVADINGDKTIGIGYSDLEEAWQFDNDPKTYISSGFFAFEAEAKNASKSKNAVYITPIDDWGNEVTDEDYGYIVGFQEDGMLDGLTVDDAKKKIIDWLTAEGKGHAKVNYKLRDWVFSRQRYWGEPIPIVHCEKCGYVPIDESELPLKLPKVESYEPTDNGESPLAKMTDWIETVCPHCGGKALRETDTMPQWAGSSWYYLRYMDPHNNKELASKDALKYWSPVDWYNGGMEHTTLHLLYSRFWHKFLYDIGIVPTPEPYAKRTSHGMILGENGEKMSKSRGNVVNPDEIVEEYGADTMRLYEMFIGDFEKAAPWSQASIKGCRRFVERFWNLQSVLIDGDKIRPELESQFNKAIKKVGEDIENIKFNTAIATLMALINDISNVKSINKEELRVFSILLNPFAPHVTEEIYEICGLGSGIIAEQSWPEYDESKCVDDSVEIVVQVNGKIKAKLNIPVDAQKDYVLELAKADENVKKAVGNMTVIKEIFVPKKLINIVVKP